MYDSSRGHRHTPDRAGNLWTAQSGVIRVASAQELVNTARVLLDQPLPAGRRIAIVGNAGGLGVLAADAANADGLVMPQLSGQLRSMLADIVPSAAGLDNPIDLAAAASPAAFEAALRTVLTSGEVDAVVVIFTATLVGDPTRVLGAIADTMADAGGVTMTAVMIGVGQHLELEIAGLPLFATADAAVHAIANAQRYAAWRGTPRGAVPELTNTDPARARRLVDEVLTSSPAGRWLDADEAVTLLEAYGIATPRTGVAGSARQATLVARSIGYPVVAKVADSTVVHKTDLGLVAVGPASGTDLSRAYRHFAAVLENQRPSIVVQQQVAAGVELAVGAVRDATFGPLVMVAAGGITIDVLDDRAFVLLPVTPQDAHRAVGSLRTAPLLHGFRGAPPGDVAGLEELLVRVGD